MPIQNQGNAAFRPRARLLLILGEELIANEVIAVVELVKNAYDADATSVEVKLDNITDATDGRIVVEDDGVGMSLDTILNVWLEPATAHRTDQKKRGERTGKFGRLLLGEKGVGRFAAHKLGDIVELVTRAEGSDVEIHLVVDWRWFEQDAYLDEIPISWEVRSPQRFTDGRHGTCIAVQGLRKAWNENMVENLATKLQGLNSPFVREMEFRVEPVAPGFESVLKQLPSLSALLEGAFYYFEGEVSEQGVLTYTYRFHHPLSTQFIREVLSRKTDIKNPSHFGFLMPQCGPFKCKFYVWDRDRIVRRALQEAAPHIEQELKLITPHTGVRVYRDNFRVWPYGEPGDDWLRLDIRRLQAPQQRLSNNQFVGFVEISSQANPQLRDKTNREGLIEGDAYQDFVELIRGAIAILEVERRPDKDQVYEWITRRQLTEQVIQGDPVEGSITHLYRKMEGEGDLPKYTEDLERLRTRYHETLESIIDPLLVAAGLGISYTIPVHEITRNITDLRVSLGAVRESIEHGDAVRKLDSVLALLDQIDGMVRGAGQIIRKGRSENVRLYSAVKDAADIMRLRLARENIQLNIQEAEPITVRGRHNLIVTAILNLIDNSAYWLLLREADRRVKITVDHSPAGEPRIVVADNGPGIQDDPALLLKPFFTRKPDGSGLGLYIVNRIMQAHEGSVLFIPKSAVEDTLLSGANVALIFPAQREASS